MSLCPHRIGGLSLPDYFVRQRWGPHGGLSSRAGRPKVGHFSVHLRNLNETTVGDAVATFSREVIGSIFRCRVERPLQDVFQILRKL